MRKVHKLFFGIYQY